MAYKVSHIAPEIRVAGPHRAWMDESPNRFAYRCLPLVIANQLGWDLINPTAFRARWIGGDAPSDVQIEWLDDAGESGRQWAAAHFGAAVLTFSTGYVFRTPPGTGLMVAGPPNLPKDGLHALSGFVETDWNETSFTMNYLFTRPNHWITFEAGEPFCRLTPMSVEPAEKLEPVIARLEDAPELAERYHAWSAERDRFNRQLKNPWSDEAKVGWKKEYFQGRRVDGAKGDQHRTQLRVQPFVDPDAPPRPDGDPSSDRRPDRRPAPPRRKNDADASRFLWSETGFFATRQRRQAEVLVGVAETLRRRTPLDGGEQPFLDAFTRFTAIDAAAVTDVLYEPMAYFWTRMAFQFIDACLNGAELTPMASRYRAAIDASDDRDALAKHLARFGIFELGACVAAGLDRRFDQPITLSLPCGIPTSDTQLIGEGEIKIVAVEGGVPVAKTANGEMLLEPGAETPEGFRCERSPVVRHAGCELRLQPVSLAGLGVEAATPAIDAGTDYQQQHAELIRRAVQSIERHSPEVFEQLSGTTRIVGLKPDAEGDYGSVSVSELPGAMLLSVFDHQTVMADRIIHELHHNRLFHIEDSGSLLDPLGDRNQSFYSPWREDPRPLLGVLHGLYVFLAVGRYWLSLWRDETEPDRELIADNALRTVLQLRHAEQTLVDHAAFTPPGEGLFAQLRRDVAELEAAVNDAGVCGETAAVEVDGAGRITPQRDDAGEPMTVRQAVARHHRRFAPG